MMTDWAWYRDITHALGCACGINDAGQRCIDTICRPTVKPEIRVEVLAHRNTISTEAEPTLHSLWQGGEALSRHVAEVFPPGGETHIEYGVESIDTEIAGFQLVGTDASAQRFSTHQRSRTVWPDGAKYVTGWKKKQ